MREHRVEVDHLRRLAFPGLHQLDGIALQQAHAHGDRRHLEIPRRSRQAVFQQGGDQRLAFDQAHLAAEGRQHESVAAEARRGIQHEGSHAGLDAHRLGDHLPAAAAELAAVRGGAFEEVDAYRPRRIRSELQQLQPVLAQLQGEVRRGVFRQFQAETLRPLPRGRLEFGAEGLDDDARRVRGIAHGLESWKKPRFYPRRNQRQSCQPPMSTWKWSRWAALYSGPSTPSKLAQAPS
ncbi:hypothetical protein D9M69_376770 [compost metagenome]